MVDMTRREVRANSKMQDLEEFRRWHAEGQTYAWMVEEYKRKYNIETSVAMFTNFATRLGLPKRSRKARISALPWVVKEEHNIMELTMLRLVARQAEGMSIPVSAGPKLAAWKEFLTEKNWVVHYEPDTDEGFFYVDARPGIDTGFVRVPGV